MQTSEDYRTGVASKNHPGLLGDGQLNRSLTLPASRQLTAGGFLLSCHACRMNICCIGRTFPNDEVSEVNFDSSRTVLDFDAAFIDSLGLSGDLGREAILFRRNDFSEFLALGRTIVVFTVPVQLERFFDIKPAGLKTLSGIRMDFKGGPDYLKAFWKSVEEDMSFLGHYETPPGQPFLFASATSKPVASLAKHERGNLLLLPWLMPQDGLRIEYQRRCSRFVAAFKKLNEHLSPKNQTVELPAWSRHYGWDRGRSLRRNLLSLQNQADQVANQIRKNTTELEIEDGLKVLFTGTGESLVDTVIAVFRELGAKADRGEPGRDDVILGFEGKCSVIEIKGKKSSAAEYDAAQLEKWVAGFKGEKGIDPKGMLLVNAYRETPLHERTEPAFPNQMLKYSTQREHCLVTGIQLLGLLLEARAFPEKRIDLVNSLFSTIGVYSGFPDWRTFLIAPTSS